MPPDFLQSGRKPGLLTSQIAYHTCWNKQSISFANAPAPVAELVRWAPCMTPHDLHGAI
jgi:hypothetical protein